MLKIVVAMLIGAGLGAALTHGLMSRGGGAPTEGLGAGAVVQSVGSMQGAAQVSRSSVEFAPALTMRVDRVAGPAGSNAGATVMVGGEIVGEQATRQGTATNARSASVAGAGSFEEALARALADAESDPSALAALQSIPERWLAVSPASVIAAVDRIDAPALRHGYLTALTRAAVSRQPELLPDIVSHLRAISEQGSIIEGIRQGLQAAEEPELLLGVADALPGMLSQVAENMVYSQIAVRDPLQALSRADTLPPGENRQMLTMQAIMQLASRDPNAALSWLGSHRDNADASLYMNVAAALSQRDPQLAAQYVSSVPESARGGWISAVARTMAASDVDGALNWLGAYRNTAYYGDAVAGVAQQLAGFDPARAAQLLAEVDAESMQGRAAVSGVVAIWAGSDPDGATAWARGLPRGDTRDRALLALAPRIGSRMLDDSMLDLFSSAQSRNSAAGSAIASVARSDPQRAQELIGAHITDPAMAQRVAAMIASGGPVQQISMFLAAPGAAVGGPTGVFMYRDAGDGAVPALSISSGSISSGVTDFILQAPPPEQ